MRGLLKFMMPRTSSAGAGLVIRSREVDLVSMQGGTVSHRIRVPMEGAEDYHVTDAIRKALEAANLKSTHLAVSIPTQHVLFRFFTIPSVPKNEWESVVQFEARKYIPFKTDWLVWDCRVLPSAATGKLDVIFAAIQRETFRRMQELLENAGVEPVLIEPRSLSLARLAPPAAKDAPEEFLCLVDIEQDSAHLAIVKDRLPYLTRDISFVASPEPSPDMNALPGGPPTKGMTDSPSVMAPVHEAVDDGTDPRLKRLFSELSVSMDFFMREYPSTRISRVIMFGDEGQVGQWAGWLSERLQTTVELGNVLLDQQVANGMPLSFSAAIGLLQPSGKNGSLDFLKRSQGRAAAAPKVPLANSTAVAADLASAFKNPAGLALAGAIAAVMAAGTWMLNAQQLAQARRQLDQVTRSATEVASELGRLPASELTSLQTTVQSQAAFLSKAIGQQHSVAARLDGLVQSLPDGVWLTKLLYEEKLDASGSMQPRLTVNGSCYLGEATKELAMIQEFQEQVKQHAALFGGFSTAQLDQINSAQDRQQPDYTFRTFQLNCSASRKM